MCGVFVIWQGSGKLFIILKAVGWIFLFPLVLFLFSPKILLLSTMREPVNVPAPEHVAFEVKHHSYLPLLAYGSSSALFGVILHLALK